MAKSTEAALKSNAWSVLFINGPLSPLPSVKVSRDMVIYRAKMVGMTGAKCMNSFLKYFHLLLVYNFLNLVGIYIITKPYKNFYKYIHKASENGHKIINIHIFPYSEKYSQK